MTTVKRGASPRGLGQDEFAAKSPRASVLAIGMAVVALVAGCSSKDAALSAPPDAGATADADGFDIGSPGEAEACVGAPLPLQNARAFTLGETFYLPRLSSSCPTDTAWEIAEAPEGSANRVYMSGAPDPRFTPDKPGAYRFRVVGLPGNELDLVVVSRSPAERFRNHYLPPLFGAARTGDDIWTANGATYTVTRVSRSAAGSWSNSLEIPVASWPGAMVWRAPLPYVLVAHRGADTIGFIDRQRGVLEDALWVGDEPTGLALSPDASTLYVSLPTSRQIAVVDLAARKVTARIDVGADPRSLALSSDGNLLFVASYRSGNREKDVRGTYGPNDGEALWAIDTREKRVVDTLPTLGSVHHAIALAEDGSELYVAATDGDPSPSQSDLTQKSFIHEAVAIGVTAQGMNHDAIRLADLTRQEGSGGPVVNPSSVLPRGDTLWIASESSGLVVGLDRATLAEKVRATIGAGALQIVATDNGIAVHCAQSNELWFVGDDGAVQANVGLVAVDGRPADVALGEQVFTRPGLTFATNHSCSSCHTETDHDGMVWRFATGLYDNVRPLKLLASTSPLEWKAYLSNTQVFGYSGPSSIVARKATPEEAHGLDVFLASLLGAPRATGRTRLDGSYTEAGLRGKALFESKAKCATCHTAPLYTNREVVPLGKSGGPADVPTLFGVYRHEAFFVKAGARRIESAVDVALTYVTTNFGASTLTAEERTDLIEFLYELTPKGGAPLGIWPDIDSASGVDPSVTPWVEFADPIDDSRGETREAVAARFVKVESTDGSAVAGKIVVEGWKIRFIPDAPLAAGAAYNFRVLQGLPFLSGGELWAERRSSFTVAKAAAGAWPETAKMVVKAALMPGTTPLEIPLMLHAVAQREDGAQHVIIEPLALGTQQRQSVWIHIDGDTFGMAPVAMPVAGNGVANASKIIGQITQIEGGTIRAMEGTLRLSGPSIDVSDLPFTIEAAP